MRRKKELLVAVLFLLTVASFAQRQKIDGLKSEIRTASDTTRVRLLNEISWLYKNINIDSAIRYAREALVLARRTNAQALIGASLNSLGSAKQAAGEYDSALAYLNQSIRIKTVSGDSSGITSELSNIGIIHDEKGDYDKALRYYFAALHLARKNGDLRTEANTLSNIGVVYKKEKEYENVLTYYQTALELYKKLNSDFGITVTSGNIGSVLIQTGDYRKSIAYARQARKGYEQLGYVRYVPYTLGNMAIAYDSLHEYGRAESLYLEAFNQHMQFGNSYEAAYNGKNLASFYLRQRRLSRGKAFGEKAIQLSKKIGAKEMLRDSYQVMASIHRSLGQFRDAYAYELEYNALKDSLFEENKTKAILEMQAKYEAESRELEISNQKARLATNELELQRRQNQILWLASLSGLFLVSGIVLYQSQRGKRKKAEQEAAFRLKLAEMERENELHQDRQRISRDLHDNIGSRLLFLSTHAETLAEKLPGENEKVLQLGAFARNTLQELRRTVWFINKDFVRLEELQLKMNEYFGFLNDSTTTAPVMAWDADPNLSVRSNVAEAIFRVAQEAVSNALKHAGCTNVTIRLASAAGGILLTIQDNGKGFEEGNVTDGGGNGLRNMRAHAKNVNAQLSITSAPGRGTFISLEFAPG